MARVDCERLCAGLGDLLAVEPDAAGLGVEVAYSLAWGPPVEELDGALLEGEAGRLAEEARARYTLETLTRDPMVRAYRDFYWRLGIDPTKTRPSSEALVRRLLRGRWPRINPVVDAGNIASARTMVPIGLYDAARFTPPLRIALTRGGERFHPIGGDPETLEPGRPVLLDARGVVMHLYPHRDSVETMVRPETSCVLIVAAGAPGVPREKLGAAVGETQRLLGLLGWRGCGRVAYKP